MSQAFQDTKPSGQLLVEFVRAGETVETWRKLVTIHRFPAGANDPKPMVGSLVRMLKQSDPDVRYMIRENPETGEVMIDFLIARAGNRRRRVQRLQVRAACLGPGARRLPVRAALPARQGHGR